MRERCLCLATDKIKKFYNSKQWRRVGKYVIKLKKGICEECGRRGNEVHHIIPLTNQNVDNPKISLSVENLQLLCTSCHNAKRSKSYLREDVVFSKDGELLERE